MRGTSPSEIETVLNEHEAVFESAVLGVTDPRRGETIMAFIAPAEGRDVTDDELRRHARARLPAYKMPRRFVFAESLPKGPTGKILKRLLRDRA